MIKGLEPLSLLNTTNNIQSEQPSTSFTEVKYANVFPGVDVYFHGKQKQLFYEFILDANADTEVRNFTCEGNA